MTNFLRRTTNYPSGIAAGGGDTGFDTQAQPTLLIKRIPTNGTADVTFPKGTTILGTRILVDHVQPATAGTVQIDNVTDVAAVLAPTPVTAYLATPIAAPTPLLGDKRFRFTTAGLVGGWASVGFDVILPRIRA